MVPDSHETRQGPHGGTNNPLVEPLKWSFKPHTNGLSQVDWLLVLVLSTMAGSVDVIGFPALGGLFTAHITRNLLVICERL